MMLSIKIKIGIVEGYIKRVPTNGALFFIISEAKEMRSVTIPQVECVEGRTRQEAVLKFNKRMIELAYVNPSWVREGDVFWITYNKLIEEPENIVEEHELNGECLHCKDCPFCDRVLDIYGNIDARVSVNLNKKVCNAYWENEERR